MLLHASLLLRLVGGDAAGNRANWQWGGVVNEIALLLFVGLAATAVVRAGRSSNAGPPARTRPQKISSR